MTGRPVPVSASTTPSPLQPRQTGPTAVGSSAPWPARLVFVRADGQREGDVGVLQMSLDDVVEPFSVLIEVHDALRFFSHPELVKLIRQITWRGSKWEMYLLCYKNSFFSQLKGYYIILRIIKNNREKERTHSIAGGSAGVQVFPALCCRNGVSKRHFSADCRPSPSS